MGARKIKKQEVYQPSGDIKRITSLCNGQWAYITDELGKNHHLKTDSSEFIEKCASVNTALDGRIVKELEVLGWDSVIQRMENFSKEGSENV